MLTTTELRAIKKELAREDGRMPIVLSALGDPGRFRIFKILMAHHEVCVTEIASILGITVSAASQQLRVLERTGLVCKERMGQMICYEVKHDDPFVQSICKFFS